MSSISIVRPSLKVYIVSGSPFYRLGNEILIPPIEWKSLEQWWEFLDEVVLLKPEIISDDPPVGWMAVPRNIAVEQICRNGDGRLARRRDTLHAARSLLDPSGILMARMPYYETAWCYQVARKIGMRHFLEIHGDWETAVLEEDSNSVFRRATRLARAGANRRVQSRMARRSICVLGVGPDLIRKYVPRLIPSLVSTNHLLGESSFSRRKEFGLKNPARLLFVGDMQRRKGLHILFEALSYLKDEGRRFEMVMIGTGPMVDELSVFAEKNDFVESIKWKGKVPHGKALYEYFKESDVFVLPSVAAEGVPRVTHEAMAFGCPVIATDIGSVSWQLEGGAGLVIPPGDASELAEKLGRVLDDASLRRKLSEKGFQKSLGYTYEKQKAAIADFVLHYVS